MSERHGDRSETPATEPAPAITSKARTADWVYVNGNQPNSARRGGTSPRRQSSSGTGATT